MNNSSEKRVLLVEDESVVRMVTGEALRDEGFEVTEAPNADEGFRRFNEPDEFDILFTDVNMPGRIDGLELASLVRRLDPDIPILIASGMVTNGDPRFAGFKPPVLFIRKPYDLGKLIATVKGMMQSEGK